MTKSDDLAKEMVKALTEYSEELANNIDEIGQDITNDAVNELKQTSPKRYGKYAKNWKVKKNAHGFYVIYNAAPTYRLTHLLENGHVLRNGRRSSSFPHIQPVEVSAVSEFERRVKEVLQK